MSNGTSPTTTRCSPIRNRALPTPLCRWGYGSCYITGKLLADRLIMEYGHQQDLADKPFVLRDFLDRFNHEGMIPVLLMELEMVPNSSARALQPQHP